MARKKGSRNKGYWFRKERGWYVGSQPLMDAQGNHIKDRAAEQEAEQAYHRRKATDQSEPTADPAGYTVKDVCLQYLKDTRNPNTKAYCSEATYDLRYRFLMDLCDGGPPKGRKVHKGYGTIPINELLGVNIQDWLDAHEWNGTRRTAIQAIRRATLWCKDLGMVDNPKLVFKAGVAGKRKAYFTEEEEKAIYATASRALAEAIKVMIATGVRPGEFTKVEVRHVEETAEGQLWRLPPDEHKTGRKTGEDRVIPVPPEIAGLVREKIKQCRRGRLFRNSQGKPWTPTGFKSAFARMRRKLAKKGVVLKSDSTLYGCRHTYAKRMLANGVNLETLAAKMGNTPQVCFDHYGKGWNKEKGLTSALWDGFRS